VHNRQPAPQTLQELQQLIEQNWRRIPQDRIRRLIESNGTPHHHTSFAEIVDLKDAVPCEPYIPAAVDTCAAISDFLANQNATVLPLPFKSPDLNPTEHLWDGSDHACTVNTEISITLL
jgi:hypothetical protein